MYLGTSAITDFAVCGGLGVAAGSCVLAAMSVVRALSVAAPTSASIVLRLASFAGFGGALLAIAAMLGETKAVRDVNSTLGFAAGAALLIPAIWLVRRSYGRA